MQISKYILFPVLILIFISSCKMDADKQQELKEKITEEANKITEPKPAPVETADFFTPTHDAVLDLIAREDGQFDTPIELKYQDLNGKIWTAPAGTITDGASIPDQFVNLFGGKLSKTHLFAAIIHDAYCGKANVGKPFYQVENWKDTHHMFYNACLKNGTDNTRAGTMYAAVRLGGPRWSSNGEPVNDLSKVGKLAMAKAMNETMAWITAKRGLVSLDEIDKWMDKLESDLIDSI